MEGKGGKGIAVSSWVLLGLGKVTRPAAHSFAVGDDSLKCSVSGVWGQSRRLSRTYLACNHLHSWWDMKTSPFSMQNHAAFYSGPTCSACKASRWIGTGFSGHNGLCLRLLCCSSHASRCIWGSEWHFEELGRGDLLLWVHLCSLVYCVNLKDLYLFLLERCTAMFQTWASAFIIWCRAKIKFLQTGHHK